MFVLVSLDQVWAYVRMCPRFSKENSLAPAPHAPFDTQGTKQIATFPGHKQILPPIRNISASRVVLLRQTLSEK